MSITPFLPAHGQRPPPPPPPPPQAPLVVPLLPPPFVGGAGEQAWSFVDQILAIFAVGAYFFLLARLLRWTGFTGPRVALPTKRTSPSTGHRPWPWARALVVGAVVVALIVFEVQLYRSLHERIAEALAGTRNDVAKCFTGTEFQDGRMRFGCYDLRDRLTTPPWRLALEELGRRHVAAVVDGLVATSRLVIVVALVVYGVERVASFFEDNHGRRQ